ncbi:hypothetical protein FRACYDRAFT_277408 [Fragilariopsis cylindrus CCMP1102]|uniref:Uncharacterized protein n=1 Tax=Fragilariopsis cylindrus CCMP1102 TaxID=635003 RepID=A0A1E7EU11_9STRA|nr:hypothetical protein FRACYDRAFT_277408 [Fragilariopsis cylindrus CCMP1102]|eukprot:OEU09284.1 hypothetical protein FRACYDRAFT_277408 [Fragilariopsis cylindrus CCMP1102]
MNDNVIIDVLAGDGGSGAGEGRFYDDKTPVPFVLGDGTILVTIPSFRDGQRCGETLLELFQTAKDPDNIVVSLVEQNQNTDDDLYCLEVYCKLAGGGKDSIYERIKPRNDSIKLIIKEEERNKCPRNDQIRLIKVNDIFTKGPTWARALGRKNLGNEEFCLQTATHNSFVQHWDEKVRKEWLLTNNEYAIISNQPKKQPTIQNDMQNTPDRIVPRNCAHYHPNWADGKVDKLKRPLLAHTWAPAFSFSKCHLEESAPYDGFTPFVSSDIEAFARFARFWTRGYDVYTPTQNIVYIKFNDQPNKHKNEWINKWKKRKDRALAISLRRIRSYLEILGDEDIGVKLDNMGIYGLGKRRTLNQLNEFVGIELSTEQSRSEDLPCGNFRWVPYNSGISPIENLYSNPDDLDSQPEFPLRTYLTFADKYETSRINSLNSVSEGDVLNPTGSTGLRSSSSQSRGDNFPYGTIFILWIFGLVLWCYVHVFGVSDWKRRKSGRGKNSDKNK